MTDSQATPPSTGDLKIDETTRKLIADGWAYAEANDDELGTRAFILRKGDDKMTVTLGLSTEGGLCAFIGIDQSDIPQMVHTRWDKKGFWRTVRPDGTTK